MNQLITAIQITMSSLEVSELTGKRVMYQPKYVVEVNESAMSKGEV